MGDLSQDDLRQVLEEKAQETIFGLFEWDDAEFRYADGEISDPNIMPVNMRVDDILLHGAQRWDEMQRFRSVFNNPGIILRRTLTKPAEELLRDRMAKTIYESINAQRSIAEIHLHAHGPSPRRHPRPPRRSARRPNPLRLRRLRPGFPHRPWSTRGISTSRVVS